MKVRSDIMKLVKSIYNWVGLCAGILLFIWSFAGRPSMFQHNISKWTTPAQQVLPKVASNQCNELIQKVQTPYPDPPAIQNSFTINLLSNEFHYASITWRWL